MLISLIGTWIQSLAQSWLVFELTNSSFLLGLVGFLNTIPVLIFCLFGGVLADRFSKRNILLTTQVAFMLLAFLLAVLTQFKIITAHQIMFIAILNGIVMAFDAPSRQAMVVEMVGKDHLFNAIALNSVAFNSSRIIGPALAGVLIAAIGMSGCFYINGISFLAVIMALLYIKVIPQRNERRNTALKDLKNGLVFIRNHDLVMTLITVVGVVSLFGISYIILMPVFANDILKVGVKGMGVLMSSSGFGALCGALLLARLGDFKNKGVFLLTSAFIFSVSLILFSLSKIYFFSCVILVIIGATSVASLALINILLQTKVPDEYRGRVMSVFMLTFAGIMPFGNLLAGSLSQLFGPAFAVLISGAVCTAFFVFVSVAHPKIKAI